MINYGVGLCKYTGARGKSGASDADAETVGYVRRSFRAGRCSLADGRTGPGGCRRRGTVAMYMANRNITMRPQAGSGNAHFHIGGNSSAMLRQLGSGESLNEDGD